MTRRAFYIVDVFAGEKYAGNQLAVIREAKDIPDEEMQQIAKEMNYSETTFILSDEVHDGGYDVRIFTPKKEIPFAGHPTLGTAYIVQKEIIRNPVQSLFLNLEVGKIPITFNYKDGETDILWMKHNPAVFGQVFDKEKISHILNLDKDLIDDKFPIQEVSTGFPCLIVPLKTLEASRKARVDKDMYFSLVENIESKGILIFAPETFHQENQLNVRFFCDYLGIPEDPATGSANGCLAGYLVKHRYFGENRVDIRVEQGYEIGRPSLLFLRSEEKEDKIDVFVGGQVVPIANGQLV